MNEKLTKAELLRWHLEAGVDETIGDSPVDRFAEFPPAAVPQKLAEAPASPVQPPASGISPAPSVMSALKLPIASSARGAAPVVAEHLLRQAWGLAEAATTVEELHQAAAGFDGCGLKKMATNTVFGDGNPKARIVFIGEGPGAEEDRQGVPFVGAGGALFDAMLGSIGLDRSNVYMSNIVFWRPPGNRTPTATETALCMPFVERLMELIDPDILVTVGGPAAKAMLAETAGVGRLRGKWYTYSTPRLSRPVQATALFHPAYLLGSPSHKREAWADLLAIRDKLAAVS